LKVVEVIFLGTVYWALSDIDLAEGPPPPIILKVELLLVCRGRLEEIGDFDRELDLIIRCW
jgi:hypothetical protein